jgi:hypothetical protein
MIEFQETQELAKTLVNVKTKKRLEPAHITGERLKRLHEFYRSWDIVGEKLDLNREMIREFTETTAKLPPTVKKLFEDNSMFKVDIAYRITELEKDEDKTGLARAVVSNSLSSADVRDIVAYKTANSGVSIPEAISRVLESKKRTVTHHIVIMELSETALQSLRREAERRGQTLDNIALTIIGKKWNKAGILSFGISGSDIVIKLTEDGFKTLQQEARASHLQIKDLAENLVRSALRAK